MLDLSSEKLQKYFARLYGTDVMIKAVKDFAGEPKQMVPLERFMKRG